MDIQEIKKAYIPPRVNIIEIDNEISLELVSTDDPPIGPEESIALKCDTYNILAFKTSNS